MSAGVISGSLVALLLERLYSWLPGSLGLCVWAVIAAAFFIVIVRLIAFIFGFIFNFIDMLKP